MASRFPTSAPRSVALAAMFAAMGPVATFATDLPLPPMVTKAPPLPAAVAPYNWSGLYVGGHLGHLWGRTHVEDNGEIAERNARTDGVVGGVMLGYNWQIQRLVFGLEGDFGWTNAHGVGTGPPEPDPEPAPAPPPPPPPPPVLALPPPPALIPVTTHGPNSYDVRWTSHVRGRIGYAVDNWHFFVAGGFTMADLSFHEGTITTTFVTDTSGGKYYGWSVGGGVEWAFTRNLFARVEYFYDDFGHKDYVGVTGDRYRVSLTGQTVRGALGWKFDPLGR